MNLPMKVHLSAAKESALTALMHLRGGQSSHVLIDNPASADLNLFLGNPTREPHLLLNHPLYRDHPILAAHLFLRQGWDTMNLAIPFSSAQHISCRAGGVCPTPGGSIKTDRCKRKTLKSSLLAASANSA
jgi:hypothetical protein